MAPRTEGEGMLEFDLEAAEKEDEERAKKEKEGGEDGSQDRRRRYGKIVNCERSGQNQVRLFHLHLLVPLQYANIPDLKFYGHYCYYL